MKDKSEKILNTIVGLLAATGFFSILIFANSWINREDKDNICSDYQVKIDNLQSTINDLEDNVSSLESDKEDLKYKIEVSEEEYNELKKQKGCKTTTSKIKLSDGSKGE